MNTDAVAAPETAAAHDSEHHKPKSSVGMVALNLATVGLFAGLILAIVNYYTEDMRIQNEIRAKEEGRKAVLPLAKTFEEIPDLPDWFRGKDEAGNPVGYVVPMHRRGFECCIKMLVGVDDKYKIVDYRILADKETPGLGSKAKEDKFKKQFAGRDKSNLIVSKTGKAGAINAITGATITSRAVADGIKDRLELLEKLARENFKTIPPELKGKEGGHE